MHATAFQAAGRITLVKGENITVILQKKKSNNYKLKKYLILLYLLLFHTC